MAELTRLLGFMSSWDRQSVLDEYEARFAAAEDPDALTEELGTPTKLAIDLARTYIPSPPPTPGALSEDPAEKLEEVPEQFAFALDPERPEQEDAPQTVERTSTAGLIAYLIPAIIIGLPITAVLVCVGLPFLAVGAAVVFSAVKGALAAVAALSLISDILLTVGVALIVCAVGLILFWLGLWLIMELCWLWVGKVLVPLGRKLCVKKEVV